MYLMIDAKLGHLCNPIDTLCLLSDKKYLISLE